jgi:excisionase family DNA binding protein
VRATSAQPGGQATRQALETLKRAIGTAAPEELPALVGELERLKLAATMRLLEDGRGQTPAPTHDPLDLLSIGDVAALLKLDRSSVYDLVRRGRLPVVVIGRAFRVRRADVAWFVEERASRQPRPAALSS